MPEVFHEIDNPDAVRQDMLDAWGPPNAHWFDDDVLTLADLFTYETDIAVIPADEPAFADCGRAEMGIPTDEECEAYERAIRSATF